MTEKEEKRRLKKSMFVTTSSRFETQNTIKIDPRSSEDENIKKRTPSDGDRSTKYRSGPIV